VRLSRRVRCSGDTDRIAETTLGLIPAWGGCTRLPRLVGASGAAAVILKGKLYSAQEVLQLGLVDDIAPPDQLLDRARKKLRAGKRKMERRAPANPASEPPSRNSGAPGELRSPKQSGNPALERAGEIITKLCRFRR